MYIRHIFLNTIIDKYVYYNLLWLLTKLFTTTFGLYFTHLSLCYAAYSNTSKQNIYTHNIYNLNPLYFPIVNTFTSTTNDFFKHHNNKSIQSFVKPISFLCKQEYFKYINLNS